MKGHVSARALTVRGLAVAALLVVAGCAMRVEAQSDASAPAYFTAQVKPILEANCAHCHAGPNHRGGYSMNTRESLLKGSHHAPVIVPGDPDSSFLVKLIEHQGPADDPMPMPPPPRPKLSDEQIATIQAWIKAGAVTPPDPLFVAPAP
jgi:mono/diheme cytochrome c family protein